MISSRDSDFNYYSAQYGGEREIYNIFRNIKLERRTLRDKPEF